MAVPSLVRSFFYEDILRQHLEGLTVEMQYISHQSSDVPTDPTRKANDRSSQLGHTAEG